MKIAVICVASLALLQLLLALNCSLNRRKGKKSHGAPDDPEDPLYRAVVAHRNGSEYAPLLCILMLLPPMYPGGTPGWVLFLPPLVVLVRFLHALGILNHSLKRPNLFRLLGAAGTYIVGLIYVGVLFWSAAQ